MVSTAASTRRRAPRSFIVAACERTRSVTVAASPNSTRSRGVDGAAVMADVRARFRQRKRRSAAGCGKRI